MEAKYKIMWKNKVTGNVHFAYFYCLNDAEELVDVLKYNTNVECLPVAQIVNQKWEIVK